MTIATMGPEIGRSALIIVDMQNDFVHPEGSFAAWARETPEAGIDLPFLMGTIPQVKRLAAAFRKAGRPVVYIAQVLKPDYSDAQFPYWRFGITPGGNRAGCVEGTWGARIMDELKPREGEHLVVTTCVVSGVTTCVCVSNTLRGGVEHNYRMILVADAVAEI